MSRLPLQGLLVLEFSQYLSGPSAGLRLADLGARVIKVERPGTGDAGRRLSIKNLWTDDSSMLFHTINRNKESYTADLKNPDDLALVKKLIEKADVLTHNFRPGIMEKVGLGYPEVIKINPRIIYGAVSGYGTEGPWKNRPGQDLLLQSMSGLAYTTGNAKDNPMPFGLAIADNLCGSQLVQGILSALIRRHKTGAGALIEVSLLESLLDFQFELLTTYHSSGKLPKRSKVNNGHPLLHAPYGIYSTASGHIAIAMVDIKQLAKAIGCNELMAYDQKVGKTPVNTAICLLVREAACQRPVGYGSARLGAAYKTGSIQVFANGANDHHLHGKRSYYNPLSHTHQRGTHFFSQTCSAVGRTQ
jgi:CoA:oxalate CoA-transferase